MSHAFYLFIWSPIKDLAQVDENVPSWLHKHFDSIIGGCDNCKDIDKEIAFQTVKQCFQTHSHC